jgi:hypothetical protein
MVTIVNRKPLPASWGFLLCPLRINGHFSADNQFRNSVAGRGAPRHSSARAAASRAPVLWPLSCPAILQLTLGPGIAAALLHDCLPRPLNGYEKASAKLIYSLGFGRWPELADSFKRVAHS